MAKITEEQIERMSLIQKLAKIRKIAEVIQKNASGFGYKYTSLDEILSYVTAGMDKYHVSLIPRIKDGYSVSEYTYQKIKTVGKERLAEPVTEFLAVVPMEYKWVNDTNADETILVDWMTTGSQSDPSQAVGSALTYGLRYFLCQYFQIATPEDDPDKWRSKQGEAESAEDKAVAKKLVEEIDKLVRGFVESNQDKVADVKKFCSKYAKNGNYNLITESALAIKFLNDFKIEFGLVDEEEDK